jgi:Bacterial membrane protein YfhO
MMTTPLKWFNLPGQRADAAALACIALFFVLFFPQGLFGGKYLLANDAFFYSYPLRSVAWHMIRRGELPLWTPYILSGYPLLSMAQIGLGYPLTWGYLILPGYIAEQIYVLVPFLLAPAFTYAYLRELGRTPIASLFGALTFGYGGMMASPLANNGLMPNAVMWLPLFLIAIEWARTEHVMRALLFGTFAYSMSVLTGYGQGFILVALLAAAYSLLLVLVDGEESLRARPVSFRRWRPVLVATGAGTLASGMAAFQIFETERSVLRSVRSALTYDVFTQGSLTPMQLWQSIAKPLFYGVDMYAYVPPLALALAAMAAGSYLLRKTERDPRVFFWLVVAVASCLMMLGQFTPFYRLAYYTPLLNRFRVPSRHAFEWTFALGVLAAYGWDVAYEALSRKRDQHEHSSATTFYPSLGLMGAATVVGILWWRQSSALRGATVIPTQASNAYTLCKIAFVLLTAAALWRAALTTNARWRFRLLITCLMVLSYIEPAALIDRWWGSINFTAQRFAARSDTTRYLNQFPPSENRVYTRVDLFSEQFVAQPRLDAVNLSAIYDLQNVAGYEPLILERYSRALGDAGVDAVHRLTTYAPDHSLLTARSHVLDLLNTRYVVAYSNLATALEPVSLDNQTASIQSLGELPPRTASTFGAPPAKADSLLLVTSLANSVDESQGATVARVRVYLAKGQMIQYELRAGIDTAEWAHDRPDVRAVIKHQLAPVFDRALVRDANDFASYRFKTQVTLGGLVQVNKVEIENVSRTATIALFGASLLDTHTQRAAPLIPVYDAAIWQPVYDERETLILRNSRALPRVWLVGEAEAVTSEEGLRRIRGESPVAFDPRQTALLEVRPDKLPQLPGGRLAPDSSAQVVGYQPNRIVIDTNAPSASVLVTSEIFYPGWEARVDGQRTPILIANYLLRGVVLPPGKHRVAMDYTAPAARNGAIISGLTFCLLAVLIIYARRSRVL